MDLSSAVDAMLVGSCRWLEWVQLPFALAEMLGTGRLWVAAAGSAKDGCLPGLPAPSGSPWGLFICELSFLDLRLLWDQSRAGDPPLNALRATLASTPTIPTAWEPTQRKVRPATSCPFALYTRYTPNLKTFGRMT